MSPTHTGKTLYIVLLTPPLKNYPRTRRENIKAVTTALKSPGSPPPYAGKTENIPQKSIYLPIRRTIPRHQTSAPEIMISSGNQILRPPGLGVKMSHIILSVRINRD